ncbi:MAG TPA: hypothetical protein VLG12_03300 [Candidatus Saccharimonadales bacterium]|nr:hypothetical protein [Candidatus Saccharimonadales bacterium]
MRNIRRNVLISIVLTWILIATMGATQDSCGTEQSFTQQAAPNTQSEIPIDGKTKDGFIIQTFVDRNYAMYAENKGEIGTLAWSRYIHLIVKSASNSSVYIDKCVSVKDDSTPFSYETETYLIKVWLNAHGAIINAKFQNKY